jgi:cysteine desulfurase
MTAYLDYQSSKPVDPRVIDAMIPYLHGSFGNPSSLHEPGEQAGEVLDKCRQTVAAFINADKDEILFTSGATESNNLALIGFALRNKDKGNNIVTSEVEHISIHNLAKHLTKLGFTVSVAPVDRYGRVDVGEIEALITDETILVSIGYASNEIGTIQPVQEIARLCDERDIAFHSDAVAAEGLLPLDVKADSIGLLSLSSNDIYGPKGVGILYRRKGIRLKPVIIGGGQEFGLRSGTENIPGIVGMAEAARIMQQEMAPEVKRLTGYRDRLIAAVLKEIPKSYLNGHPTERLPNNAHFRFDGIEGEGLLLLLGAKGIAASTGSACSSKTLEPSRTLLALGLSHEQSHGSLELTCGRFSNDEDVEAVLHGLPKAVERLREISPIYGSE